MNTSFLFFGASFIWIALGRNPPLEVGRAPQAKAHRQLS